jgi:triacylglycerol lipase
MVGRVVMKIVFVHGIFSTRRMFFYMKKAFERDGHECFAPNLKPMDVRCGIEDLAYKL